MTKITIESDFEHNVFKYEIYDGPDEIFYDTGELKTLGEVFEKIIEIRIHNAYNI